MRGSCLCSAVVFEVDQTKIWLFNHCHCTSCRKVSGAAFGSFLQVRPDGFRWISGHELVGTFESSPGNHRAFCKVCGSRAPQSSDWTQNVTVPAGSLDTDPGVGPELELFVKSKVAWCHTGAPMPSLDDAGDAGFLGRASAYQARREPALSARSRRRSPLFARSGAAFFRRLPRPTKRGNHESRA